ncbi:MAG TPA: hypothetical protein VKD90_00905 [Gemmataceae bacterium]|nr:hypothetical protein [Gemmataceae bacterium]
MAGAYHGVPADIRRQALDRLDDHLRRVVAAFEERFPGTAGPGR